MYVYARVYICATCPPVVRSNMSFCCLILPLVFKPPRTPPLPGPAAEALRRVLLLCCASEPWPCRSSASAPAVCAADFASTTAPLGSFWPGLSVRTCADGAIHRHDTQVPRRYTFSGHGAIQKYTLSGRGGDGQSRT